jgi:hypothetical protein
MRNKRVDVLYEFERIETAVHRRRAHRKHFELPKSDRRDVEPARLHPTIHCDGAIVETALIRMARLRVFVVQSPYRKLGLPLANKGRKLGLSTGIV